jgi:mRNA-degrading endonuclease RelE of RelBE toxin-antitoxin system
MYEIEYTASAQQDLAYFKRHEQVLIYDQINEPLKYEPTRETRNRKRTRPNNTAEWELRIDRFRVFYDVDTVVRIVSIEAIGEKDANRIRFRGRHREL